METKKRCTKCKIELPLAAFKPRSDNKAKLRSQCRECEKSYMDARRKRPEIKEQEKNYNKLYNEANKKKRSEYNKDWYQC